MSKRLLVLLLASLPVAGCNCSTEPDVDPEITVTLEVSGLDAEGCLNRGADVAVSYSVAISEPDQASALELVLAGETAAISSRDEGSPLRNSSEGTLTLSGGCLGEECLTAEAGDRSLTLTALLFDEDVAGASTASFCVR